MYLELGLSHICDWQAYDHILFVIALCGVYLLRDWKAILVLITAFTIGHSITLALSVFNQIKLPTQIVEFLIPVTIVLTSLSTIFSRRTKRDIKPYKYVLTLVFGFIHGMGFSNYLRSLLGHQENIVYELLAFNIGLELGQILVVMLVLATSYLFLNIFRTPRREWNLFLSSAIFGIALIMALDRFQELV